MRIALNLKGICRTRSHVDLMKGKQREEAYRKVNPQMLLPAVVDDEDRSCSSRWRSWNISTRWPASADPPSDPLGRARVRALAIVASDSHPLIVPRVRNFWSTI